ncbi:hypothetical protein ILUMI_13262 [Ignelater luminosus]|uniref:Uncharacterized protein n=1 Tax=Ignelater luminosus TaxID=2038154 RepID=A0A8K0CWK3_IGNLU|nr:hypothetical protein ILUMI_13262 [Ignelater luminosus]
MKLGWYDSLLKEIAKEFDKWKVDVLNLKKLKIPRWLTRELNPADLPSRGCSAKQLMTDRWWLKEESKWSWSVARPDLEQVNLERQKIVV